MYHAFIAGSVMKLLAHAPQPAASRIIRFEPPLVCRSCAIAKSVPPLPSMMKTSYGCVASCEGGAFHQTPAETVVAPPLHVQVASPPPVVDGSMRIPRVPASGA